MSFLIPPRQPSRELLDDPEFPPDEIEPYLEDLELVNRLWGNGRMLAGHLEPYLQSRNGSRCTILDVGAGSGKLAAELASRLSRRNRRVRVLAVDVQWRHLAAGRAHNGGPPPASVAADAFTLPFPDASADWIVSTLFLHHFSPEENTVLLREISRVARIGFAMMDIRRHRFPLSFIRLVGRLSLGSPASLQDGAASVRQSYTVEEARDIARRAVPGARVKRVFPFRLLVFKPPPPLRPVDGRLSIVDSSH